MSITEAILFIASNSNACMPCIQFVSKQRIPMQLVRLDTEASRRAAANGKFFQITTVPTMVIMYEDGNVQLFLGTPKIIQWLTAMIKSASQKSNENSDIAIREEERPQNMYGPISAEYPIARTRRPIIDEGEDIEDYHGGPVQIPRERKTKGKVFPIVIEDYPDDVPDDVPDDYPEDYPDDVPVVNESSTKPKKVKKGRAKTKSKPVEDNDPNAGKRKLAKEKLNRAASAKSKPLSSRMKDVYNTAKQMEEDMKNSLGYKEEELPHY